MSRKKREVWSFGGGKGGVGKSIICANVALALAEKGVKVVLIDLDFGAANLHTCLGMTAPKISLHDFLIDTKCALADCLVQTPYEGVYLIGGGEDSLKIANPKIHQLKRLIAALQTLNADYILLDLGAGTTTQTIDTFIQADKGVLVCMPEPSSIENTYRFIKYAFYRKLKLVIGHPGVRNYLEQLILDKQTNVSKKPNELIKEISAINQDAGALLRQEMSKFSLNLVMNQVRNNNDVRLGFSMSTTCERFFGIRLDYTGFVEVDDSILQSARTRVPVLSLETFAKSSRGIRKIMQNLENNEHVVTSVL